MPAILCNELKYIFSDAFELKGLLYQVAPYLSKEDPLEALDRNLQLNCAGIQSYFIIILVQ